MAQLTATAFLAKWDTKFADNTSGNITEAFLREFTTDIADSFLTPSVQAATDTVAGVVQLSPIQAGNLVIDDGRVITGTVLNLVLSSIRTRLNQKENTGVAQSLVSGLLGGVDSGRDTLKKLSDAIDGVTLIDRVVADIAERNSLPGIVVPALRNNENVYVTDATGDPSVASGPAIYKWVSLVQSWVKISEPGAIDFTLTAEATSFDAGTTGMAAVNVQSAITELYNLIQNVQGNVNLANYYTRTETNNLLSGKLPANGDSGNTTVTVADQVWWGFATRTVKQITDTLATTVKNLQTALTNVYTKSEIDSLLSGLSAYVPTKTSITLTGDVIDLTGIDADIIDVSASIDTIIVAITGGLANREYAFRATGTGNISFLQANFEMEGQLDYELDAANRDYVKLTRYTGESRWRQTGGASYGPADFSGNGGVASLTAPVALAATAMGQTGLTANWSIVQAATGYYLDVSESITFASFLPGYENLDVGNVISRVVTWLNASTTYYYRVRAYNATRTSSNSNTQSAQTTSAPTAPATPTGFQKTREGAQSVVLEWDAMSNTTGYRVSRSGMLGGTYTQIADIVGTEYTDTVLIDGTTYFYKVLGYNAVGSSPSTTAVAASTYLITDIVVGGDSYSTQPPFGLNTGEGWVDILAAAYGATIDNQAVGGRGAYRLVENFRGVTRNISPAILMAGLNDIRRGGSATPTMKKIYNCLKSAIVRYYLGSGVGFTNSAAWTASDGWFPYFNNFDAEYASILGGGQGIFTQAANKTLTGSRSVTRNLVIGYFADQTLAEPFEVFINSVSQGVFNGNGESDGISDGTDDNIRCPATLIFPLSPGNYTVQIISRNAGANYCMLDYAGTMIDPSTAQRIYVSKIPALPDASWSLGSGSGTDQGSEAVRTTANTMLAGLVQEFQTLGYPVFLADPDENFNPLTDMQADAIHRNAASMIKTAASIRRSID